MPGGRGRSQFETPQSKVHTRLISPYLLSVSGEGGSHREEELVTRWSVDLTIASHSRSYSSLYRVT